MSDYVSLENLGQGAAIELFNAELQKVLDNINDDNTMPTLQREVTLKIKVKPNENRDIAEVDIQATAKLAPTHPFATHILIGKERGKVVAREYIPKQANIFKQDEGVTPLWEVK
jgi:hypothetical protein